MLVWPPVSVIYNQILKRTNEKNVIKEIFKLLFGKYVTMTKGLAYDLKTDKNKINKQVHKNRNEETNEWNS